eukprot:1060951-Ditylum_brightwellii.AAC.1
MQVLRLAWSGCPPVDLGGGVSSDGTLLTHATFLALSLEYPKYIPTRERDFHFGIDAPSAKDLSRT